MTISKVFVGLLCLLFLNCNKDISNQNENNEESINLSFQGKVLYNQQGVPRVVVTDGKNFSQTDEDGFYSLPYSSNITHIYFSTPSGYTVPLENSVPKFWIKRSDFGDIRNINFELIKLGKSDNLHYFIAIADPQVRNLTPQLDWLKEILNHLKLDIETNGLNPVHLMVAGDIVAGNQTHMHDPLKSGFKQINEPVYYAIGNHDHVYDENESPTINNNNFADSVYIRHYGPTYYSFNRGNVHYIILDNILWEGGYPPKYSIGFTQEQLDWVKENLTYVSKDKAVVVMFHAPSKSRDGARRNYGNSAALHNLLNRYSDVQIISGHTHFNSVLVDHSNITEHIVGTICGAWWRGPVAVCGTPLGYKVFKVEDTTITWQFRAHEYPDKQFTIYKPGPRDSRLRPQEELLVNVWDWDPGWNISYSEDNGMNFKNMTRIVDRTYDPTALEYYGEVGDQTVSRSSVGARNIDHMFMCVPSHGTTNVIIKAVNRFGKEFVEEVEL